MRVLSLCLALAILPGFVFPTNCHASKLSDAMDSSANDDKSSLHGDSNSDSDCDSDDSFFGKLIGSFFSAIFSSSDDSSEGSSGYSGSSSKMRLELPIDASYGVPFHGDITSIARFSLAGVLEGQRNGVGLYFAGGVPAFREGSLLDRGAKNPSIFEFGFLYNHYLTRSHTFFSPYFTSSVGVQGWSWEYRNPIEVNAKRVTDDNLLAFNGYAGLGVSTKRKAPCSVFLEAGVGGTAFSGKSREGLDNDVFDSFGYVSVKTGLNFRF
jgi:hypothetical protein